MHRLRILDKIEYQNGCRKGKEHIVSTDSNISQCADSEKDFGSLDKLRKTSLVSSEES